MAKSFRLKQPRMETEITCSCFAAQELFVPWEKMTKAARKEFEVNGPIPCEGGGLPGEWCERCRFGEISEPEEK